MTDKEAMKLALEALEPFSTPNWAGTGVDKANAAITAIKEALAQPEQEPVGEERLVLRQAIWDSAEIVAQGRFVNILPEQEHKADCLNFAQWTASEKDLSDYICVGSLTLACIKDEEFGQCEIDSFENTIEALQQRLITGCEHKKVPLLAYIGALKPTPPQREWVGLTDEEFHKACWESYVDPVTGECSTGDREHAVHWTEAKLKEKNT